MKMEKDLLEEEYYERNDVVERESRRGILIKAVAEEIKKAGGIALPMVAVVLSQFMLQVVSTMMVGHLGQLSLASSALAISLASVSGFSFLTRATPFTMEVFHGVLEFFRFGIPSAIMICLEWWSFELLILLSGLLSDPELETSVLSICLTTTSTLYTIPYGVGAAGSTRVSNELGAGNPIGARIAVYGVMSIAVLEGITVSSTLFALRNVYGYAFSSDEEVVSYVTRMAPFICISVIVDSLQGVISGVARGCGWQHIGAAVNLGAYYLFGIPIAAVLGFCLELKGKGLWLGILAGAALQTLLLFFVTARVDWENEAREARRRIFQGDHTACNEEIDEERLLAN